MNRWALPPGWTVVSARHSYGAMALIWECIGPNQERLLLAFGDENGLVFDWRYEP